MEKVNFLQKFRSIDAYWDPKIVGELNGQVVKIAKLKGEFIWHKHEAEDEFFYVLKGQMTIKLPQREIHLSEGEFFIVPRGVEHKPVADEEVYVVMFEPLGTLNTGDVRDERTIEDVERI